ncbi:bile acid:sodium symporter family protein [Skermania piniformis]|uniref:Bile acid:sodium symporter n=1 Tax=Skermania pinensis TaxID=39122 RepID=A0ABX8SBR6_9ACTN|nr:bile acid:sodium symporter family protein [Skermania piniformis]QXQ13890.1 bile acid:sodium symporter [Skermania piniformis]
MRLPSKLPVDGFVLAILAVAVLAGALPARGAGADMLGWITKIAIAGLFLLYGARLSTREALAGLRHWRLHAVVLACTYLAFPIFGWAAQLLVPSALPADLYSGLLYLCLVPSTVQSSIVFTSIAKGNVAGAVVSASLSNLVGVFLTPVLVIALMHTTGGVAVDPSSVLDIVGQLLVPFVAGQLLRPWIAGWVSAHSAGLKLVDRGSILLVVYSAFSASTVEGIWHTVSPVQVLALLGCTGALLAAMLAVSAGLSRLLRFGRGDRIVVVFCGSKKSLASGLPMATVLFAGQPIGLLLLPLMLFHQIQLIVCAALADRWGRAAPE